MPVNDTYTPDPRHTRLGDPFYDAVQPARFPEHTLRFRHDQAAAQVGLDQLDHAEWETHFARFDPLPDNITQSLALRYHGHQFQRYNPNLGDGRGFLYAQLRDRNDRLLDLGTKGSGTTPWSRGGDGRLTLKGGVREVLAAEMLEARGVDTCRVLSIYETHEKLIRHDEPSPTRSCVLTRLQHSHIRFGTFQRLAYHGEPDLIRRLVDYCVRTYMPDVVDGDPADHADTPLHFLRQVARNVADTCARWMTAGFVHGVLNTDNMLVTGQSFDYGPWRFLPIYAPGFTAAYFDHTGLYAFGRQPEAVGWNVHRLAETLMGLTSADALSGVVEDWPQTYAAAEREAILRRLNLQSAGEAADAELADAIWVFLEASQMFFDQFWHDWLGGLESKARAMSGPAAQHYAGPRWQRVERALSEHEIADPARMEHPQLQQERPESMIIDEMEALWDPIAQRDDWGPFYEKVERIRATRE